MYKIGEFSKITKLTVKTLRYYDDQNILNPSYRDEETSYRYYSEDDFKKAELIMILRNLDFSISEIKDLLNSYENSSDLAYYLEEKKEIIENRIQQEKLLLKKIDLYINSDKEEVSSMSYEIKIKDLEPVKVASIRFRGKYSDVGKYIGKIYKAIKGKALGEPFNCYYDSEYTEEADIELCVPTSEVFEDDEVIIKRLPRIRAITTVHKGDYETINKAYKSLLDYAKDKNYKCLTPSREIYIKGPGKIFRGNPNNYITEIIIPIE